MIPLSDNHPTHTTPLLTWALIVACVGAFLLQLSLPEGGVYQFGFIPALTLGGYAEAPGPGATGNPGWPTLFTSMFMHGGWMHLGGNMLYLYVFGDNLEDRLGRGRFILFYLLGGVAAAMAQGLPDPSSTIPMVGASGAISALLGGYLVLFPRQSITVLIPNAGVVQMPALAVLGLWFATQFLTGLMDDGSAGVAFWAHVGGFVAGAALVKVFALGTQPAPTRPQLWK